MQWLIYIDTCPVNDSSLTGIESDIDESVVYRKPEFSDTKLGKNKLTKSTCKDNKVLMSYMMCSKTVYILYVNTVLTQMCMLDSFIVYGCIYTVVTYCVMLSDSPSSQNSSPVAVCWSSSATNSEKLFCLVAVVVSSGCCIGKIYPPRT